MDILNIAKSVFWFLIDNPEFLMAALGALLGVLVTVRRRLGISTATLIVLSATMIILWLGIGIRWVLDRSEAYDYALAYSGVTPFYNLNNEDAALQVGVTFGNTGPGAIQYKAENFRVVIGSTTIATPPSANDGGIIPSGTGRIYRFPPFKKSQIEPYFGTATTGTIEFTVAYGRAGGRLNRRLHMVLDVTEHFDEANGPIADTIRAEAYSGR